ncbi:MAG: DNA repair protein RadA [Clostridiales bacterium]|nr:DNA repair protein RadA [Clostridiales bacterium]
MAAAKTRTVHVCQSCGYETAKWLGRCPSCGEFNMFEAMEKAPEMQVQESRGSTSKAVSFDNVPPMGECRIPTRISELDCVLSGGIVSGSLILIGGDPGIGKSTLLLQICQNLGEDGKKILYVSGEESVQQIKLRADRMDVNSKRILLLAETSISALESAAKELKPDLVVVDSIQTIIDDTLSSTPGSVTQVRACTASLMRIAKGLGISVFIVGHVTKEGAIAGPRVLEHMVDTVLYFEGERGGGCRMIRAVKNRFGSTNEVGVFEMGEKGLKEIRNPSEYMLSGRPIDAPGSVVTCSVEGTRPILAEVQALACATSFPSPRRTATGLDYNRVVMLLAVLEKRAGIKISDYDCYVNIAGGMKIVEPSLDAAVIASVASSALNKAMDPLTMFFGEVGLTGELRAVGQTDKRIIEASKMGFKTVIMPSACLKGAKKPEGCRILGASNIAELVQAGLSNPGK